MFRYRNVMIASYALFFFSTLVHLIYSCLTLPKNEIVFSLLCGGVLFAVPLIFTLIGKLRRAQPYVLVTFFSASCFVLSIINSSAFYLPVLFAAAVVVCGFFLSSKLCLYYLMLTDVILIANVFLMPDEAGRLATVYLTVCVCYNFSGLGMTLFVQAMHSNLIYLRKKNKKLSISNRKNDEFWAASTEQMNDIAVSLSEICSNLLARNDISAPVRERVFKIHSETGRLSMALNDAEDYALMESGSMSFNKQAYSFHSLVSDVSNFCFAVCSNPNLDIIIDCQPDIPSVLVGDCRRIMQVILNLFENSVKFTQKGSVTVKFSARKTADGVNLHIEVTDTGAGIKPNAANRIFTVYAENDGEKPVVHLGLGVAKRLVSLMGGFIYARNVKTGGSRFVVTIPQEVENPLPFVAVPDHEKINVLLYLKSSIAANAYHDQLKKLGIRCIVCRSRADFMLKKDDSEITHIFFDYGFYPFDKPIFDIMARVKTVSAICGDGETEMPLSRNIKMVLKPLTIGKFSYIFNKGPSNNICDAGQEFFAPGTKVLITGTEQAQRLKEQLSAYKIESLCIDEKDIITQLENSEYDLIFLCGKENESTAAKIMLFDDSLFMNIPVIEVGENTGGCSDSLSKGFSAYQLNEILLKWLPDDLIKPVAVYNEPSTVYEELDSVRGMTAAGGSKSAYKEMLEIFEDRVKESFKTLSQYISNKDFEHCSIILQGIRSAAASIGAVSVAEIARQTLSAAERKEQALSKELNGVLNAKLTRLLTEISQYLEDNGIKQLDEFLIGQAAEKIEESLADKMPEITVETIEKVLENYVGYWRRTLLKSALSQIRAGDYEGARDQLDKLKKGEKKGEGDND